MAYDGGRRLLVVVSISVMHVSMYIQSLKKKKKESKSRVRATSADEFSTTTSLTQFIWETVQDGTGRDGIGSFIFKVPSSSSLPYVPFSSPLKECRAQLMSRERKQGDVVVFACWRRGTFKHFLLSFFSSENKETKQRRRRRSEMKSLPMRWQQQQAVGSLLFLFVQIEPTTNESCRLRRRGRRRRRRRWCALMNA